MKNNFILIITVLLTIIIITSNVFVVCFLISNRKGFFEWLLMLLFNVLLFFFLKKKGFIIKLVSINIIVSLIDLFKIYPNFDSCVQYVKTWVETLPLYILKSNIFVPIVIYFFFYFLYVKRKDPKTVVY